MNRQIRAHMQTRPYQNRWIRSWSLILFLLLVGVVGYWQVSAQDVPPDPAANPETTEVPSPSAEPTEDPVTPTPVIKVTRSEPASITNGQKNTLTVLGENFTATTIVRLVDYGLLETTLVNSGALMAALPENIPARVNPYRIEVSDPNRAVDTGSTVLTLLVVAPQVPPKTTEPPPTPQPATPLPGQPSLVARNFVANPSITAPGGTVTLTFEVVNQGNRVAQGVSVSVDAGGKFAPANGQASATLPDLPVGGIYTVSLTVVAAMDTPAGPNTVPVTMAYRDFSGQGYTSKASLSVTISESSEASQVTLARYMVEPNPVEPGKPVDVTVLVTNTGNDTASQVLLRVAGDSSVLLAGPQGDSFPLGDLAPGASASLVLPLVVSTNAKSGPQAQPITISFLQKGESKQVSGSMTIDVAKVATPLPLLLLESYDIGAEILKPGDQFTLTLNLQNVGDAAANDLLVVFGTVESTGGSTGDDKDGGSGGNSGSTGGGSSTSTTPSSTFATLGTGGTVFVGSLDANGGKTTVTQEFIVNGKTESGIYNLPITLRYLKPDGTQAQDNLRASVVVVAPPKLQFKLQSPIPETVNVGEPLPVALDVTNTGQNKITLTKGNVEVENGDLLDGKETLLSPIATDEDAAIPAVIMASAEGQVSIKITLHYLDDLNQERSIVHTYQTQAVMPPPPPEDVTPPPDVNQPPVEEEQEDNTLGRLLLGLLGLGS